MTQSLQIIEMLSDILLFYGLLQSLFFLVSYVLSELIVSSDP